MTLSLKNSWAVASGGWLKDRTVKRVANMRTPDGLRIITSCSVLGTKFGKTNSRLANRHTRESRYPEDLISLDSGSRHPGL